MVDPRIIATIGLIMDIAGIWLLFRFGAIGSSWIDAPKRKLRFYREPRPWWEVEYGLAGHWEAIAEHEEDLAEEAVERNEKRALRGARWGFGLAVAGFGLQGLAQWLPELTEWLQAWL